MYNECKRTKHIPEISFEGGYNYVPREDEIKNQRIMSLTYNLVLAL